MQPFLPAWPKALFLLLFLLLNAPMLQAKPVPVLRVGLAGSTPFVIQEKQGYTGIAVEIWEQLAEEEDWKYEFRYFSNVHEALDSMTAGRLDLVVGPVSITSDRAAVMRFSQPFYQSSLAILSRMDKPGIWERILPFFSFKLLIAIGVFLLILALVGTLIWLAERRASPEQFPLRPAAGIANGMWLAIVTMSTTGYGDRAPVTFWGRIIAGSWMVISIIFATSMVAGIASTLTLSGMGHETITSLEQASGKKVATIAGSPAEEFLADLPVQAVPVVSLDEAYQKLKNKEVDAVLYDRPQLLYFLKRHPDNKVQVAKAEYYKQGYGFAFPLQTTLQHEVNVRLLALSEENKIDRSLQYWLQTNP